MHPADCPKWEYDDHPRRFEILREEVPTILSELRLQKLATKQLVGDNRLIHLRLFRNLTPAGCDYYAGHYRGEGFRCLLFHKVGVGDDPRVGYPPEIVDAHIKALIQRVDAAVRKIDLLTDPVEKLYAAVQLASHYLESFFRIHPYVNGNGHMGRFGVWAILGRYGYWPTRWPVEPRPPNPPYRDLIVSYRNGDHAPLETFFLTMLISGS
jgi:Fic family protein